VWLYRTKQLINIRSFKTLKFFSRVRDIIELIES